MILHVYFNGEEEYYTFVVSDYVLCKFDYFNDTRSDISFTLHLNCPKNIGIELFTLLSKEQLDQINQIYFWPVLDYLLYNDIKIAQKEFKELIDVIKFLTNIDDKKNDIYSLAIINTGTIINNREIVDEPHVGDLIITIENANIADIFDILLYIFKFTNNVPKILNYGLIVDFDYKHSAVITSFRLHNITKKYKYIYNSSLKEYEYLANEYLTDIDNNPDEFTLCIWLMEHHSDKYVDWYLNEECIIKQKISC